MGSLIIVFLLLGSCQSQQFGIENWANQLANSITQMQAQIQRNVQENIRTQLSQIDALNQEITQQIKNIPRQTPVILNGRTIIANGNAGIWRTIMTNSLPNGDQYYRDTVDRVVNNILYHNETILDPQRKIMNSFAYKLNLTDPNARPIFI